MEQFHKKVAIIQDAKFGKKSLITSTVFFNLAATVWKDQGPDEEDDNEVDDEEKEDPGSRRFRGQVERRRMMKNMQQRTFWSQFWLINEREIGKKD